MSVSRNSYNPQSEALYEFFGACGTLGKKVKPVSFSRSLTLIRSFSLTDVPFGVSWLLTNAAHLISDAEQSLRAFPLLPFFVLIKM